MLLFSHSFASDEPFTGPANWGGTGLMEIPTARVMRENSYRIGVSQIYPYRHYYGAISPLKGLEIEGRITEISGVFSNLGEDYGYYKDKVLDFKYQIISEGKYIPAVALGLNDPHGTRLYGSQYIVASKQIYPFDFTFGIGNGRFGKKPLPRAGEGFKLEIIRDMKNLFGSIFSEITGSKKSYNHNLRTFWGIQFAPSDKYALMIEYSPVLYHRQTRDPAYRKYFKERVPSNYNFGFRWKPLKWAEVDLSYQRGNQYGINISMDFDIGKPILPIYDHEYKEKPLEQINSLEERITKALHYKGFSDIGIALEYDNLVIEAQNDKYFYTPKAFETILKIVHDIAPDKIQNVTIVLKDDGISMAELKTTKPDIDDLYNEKLTLNEFLYLSSMTTDISKSPGIATKHRKSFNYGMKPSFQTFLNDPSGFFKYRFGITGWISYQPWKGASLVTGVSLFPFNTVSTSNKPLSIPVRSDLVFYKQENISLSSLMVEQIYKTDYEIFGRVSGGILETQYAGIDGEIAKPLFGGRIMLGISGSAVKKRDINRPFGLKEKDRRTKDIYTTAFFNTRINIPEKEISIDIKTGKFLAGDNGTSISVSKFINGVVLSAWYSFTDTSIFRDKFNKGYHNKGVAVSIPLRLFKGADSKTSYSIAISPWTRDVAQDIAHFNNLFDFIGRNQLIYFDKDKQEIFK